MKHLLYGIILILFVSVLEAKESVYFLHGFMRSSSSMKKMARSLQKEGYDVYLWGYPSKKNTIEEHAEHLTFALQETARQHPGDAIHFVTHSLGGIIVRAALNHEEVPHEAKIGKAVLLAPPNQGSRFGQFLYHIGPIRKFFGKKTGRQLLTYKNFDDLGSFPEAKKVLIISGTLGWNPILKGKNDGKLTVMESGISTPHTHITVPCGHSWIMWSKIVITHAITFINQDTPQ